MVKKIFNFIGREIVGLHEAAYLLAFFTFFSQVLALVRDRILASTFGTSSVIDVYYASFRIPDLIFVIITSLISASVLVPFLTKHLDDKQKVKHIVDSLFSFFLIMAVLISCFAFFFLPILLRLAVPGIASGPFSEQLLVFSRILLLSPILLGLSQLFGSVVQSYRRFFIYAISPVLYNLGIILGIVFLYPALGNVGLVLGVIVGLLFHVAIQIPTVYRKKLLPKFTLHIDWQAIKEVILVSLPRTITLASTQIILLVLVAVASLLTVGSITVFNFAYNLQAVPLAIIGVSYTLAAFPTLSRLFVIGKTDEFLNHLITAARHIIFWSIPVISMFVVLRAQIVRTIFGSGEFNWNDTRLTAAALAIFSVSVLSQCLILLFVRGYYSSGQTRKPLLINIFSLFLTLILIFTFVSTFKSSEHFRVFIESLLRVRGISGTVVLMLPLAFSIGMIINSILLWISFEKDFRGFSKTLWRTLRQSFSASIIAGFVAFLFLQLFAIVFDLTTLRGIFLQGLISGILGLLFGLSFLVLFKNPEVYEIWKALKHKIWKIKPTVIDQEDLLS